MFAVDTYLELLALNRALMEVRFLGGDVDDAVRGSLHLAELHVRLIDEVIAYHRDREEGEKAESWEQWRAFGGRALERRGIVEYLSAFWARLESGDLKRKALEGQMLPFVYGQEDFDGIYGELERRSLQK